MILCGSMQLFINISPQVSVWCAGFFAFPAFLAYFGSFRSCANHTGEALLTWQEKNPLYKHNLTLLWYKQLTTGIIDWNICLRFPSSLQPSNCDHKAKFPEKKALRVFAVEYDKLYSEMFIIFQLSKNSSNNILTFFSLFAFLSIFFFAARFAVWIWRNP